MYAKLFLKGLGGQNVATQLEHSGIEWFSTSNHAKARRVANLLIGRKCDIEVKRTKTRTLVKIYH